MSNPVEAFTKNSFVDKCMKLIPDDPLTQSKYMYYLTCVVFFGLIGYGLTAWYNFFVHSTVSSLFSGLFMTAIGLISSFGLKQTRNSYLAIKSIYSQPKQEIQVEPIDEMKKAFDDEKIQSDKGKKRNSK